MGFYKLTEEAVEDLDRIWRRWLEQWSEVQADEYYNAFFDRFELLAEQPLLYPSVAYIRSGFRKSVCGVDTIFYRVDGEGIEIMGIVGRQDLKNRF